MTGKIAYLYVLDTLADWEPGFLTAELNSGRYFAEPGARIPVRTAGLENQIVRPRLQTGSAGERADDVAQRIELHPWLDVAHSRRGRAKHIMPGRLCHEVQSGPVRKVPVPDDSSRIVDHDHVLARRPHRDCYE